MIIKNLSASNVLRYSQLELKNLPPHGIIGVSGSNESGKTTIAETVCLAFFGRTFSHDEHEIQQTIKWGEFEGSVTVGFSGQDQRDYNITRTFDADGNHSAQLRLLGDERPFLRGVIAVNHKLKELAGFDYNSFVGSFYLAQRNISAPHEIKKMVKSLAGVDTLEFVSNDCGSEFEALQEKIGSIYNELTKLKGQRQELNIDSELLPRIKTKIRAYQEHVSQLEQDRGVLDGQLAKLKEHATGLTDEVKTVHEVTHHSFAEWVEVSQRLQETVKRALKELDTSPQSGRESFSSPLLSWIEELQAHLAEYRFLRASVSAYKTTLLELTNTVVSGEPSARRSLPLQRRSIAKLLGPMQSKYAQLLGALFTTVIIALGIWTSIWYIEHGPDLATNHWLRSAIETANNRGLDLMVVGSVAGLLSLWLLASTLVQSSCFLLAKQDCARLLKKEESLSAIIRKIETPDTLPLADELTILRTLNDKGIAESLKNFVTGSAKALYEPHALLTFMTSLSSVHKTFQEGWGRVLGRILEERDRTITGASETRDKITKTLSAQRNEEARLQKATRLDTLENELEDERRSRAHDAEVRSIARTLLAGSHRRLVSRFNLEIRRVVGQILPWLSEDRYQTMQIDHNLNILVWSNEKGNFVAMGEVSGGAFNQVMLALRFALSQALVTASRCRPAFIILDEPFAFFDTTRARTALETLPRLSDDIQQLWVIAQRFDDDTSFKLHLRCTGDADVLVSEGNRAVVYELKPDRD